MRRTQGGAGKRFRAGAVAISVAAATAVMSGWWASAAQAATTAPDLAYVSQVLVGTGQNAYYAYVVDAAAADGSGAHAVLNTQGFPTGLALSPDGSQLAEVVNEGVTVGPIAGPPTGQQVASCSCRGDVRWLDEGTILVGAPHGDEIVKIGNRSATALPGNSAVPVESLSPDLALTASFDPRAKTLTVKNLANGRVSYQVGFPTGTLDPRLSVASDVAWSPDGATLAVSLKETDYTTEKVQKVFLVNAATGAVTSTTSGLCAGSQQQSLSWDPAGASVLVGCWNGTARRVTLAGAVSTLPITTSGPYVSAGGGPQLPVGVPAVAATKVSAKATAPGQVTVSATLPAADIAGAEVTGPGGADYGRLLGSKLVVHGLTASKSYSFTVTPKTWAGASGPQKVTKMKTEKSIGTVTTVTGPAHAIFGSRVAIQVKVTRADNGRGVAKRSVVLRRTVLNGKSAIVGRGVTNASGVVTFALAQRDDSTFTASESGSSTVGSSVSAPKQVLARIHVTETFGKRSGSQRLVTAHLDPARLVHGLLVKADDQYKTPIKTCLPVHGQSAGTISCSLTAGKKYVFVPLGPVFEGDYLGDGPGFVVTIPK